MRTLLLSLAAVLVLFGARPAFADARLADLARSSADQADDLARAAGRSEDRAIRKKLADRAADLSDDLSQLARRARKDTPAARIAQDAKDLARDAEDLVDLADEAEDRRERKTLREKAERLERKVAQLRRAAEDLAEDDDRPRDRDRRKRRDEPPPPPPPMAPDAFNSFVAAIKAEHFESNQLQVVATGVQSNFFTTNQIAAVMDIFSFGSGKVEAASRMWTRVLDPQNSFVLYQRLTFSSDKEKLRQRIGR